MPAGYEKMKAKFQAEGMPEKAAATKAAKIWNKKNKKKVTRKRHRAKTILGGGRG